MKYNPDMKWMLLWEAQQHANAHITEGSICMCCGQFVKQYRRRLSRPMAEALLALYKAGGTTEYVHSPTVLGANRGAEARLSYWRFIQELMVKRPDGGRRGYWKVTPRGEKFLNGNLQVPEFALVYNGEFQGLIGDPVDIKGAMKNGDFNLIEEMGGQQ